MKDQIKQIRVSAEDIKLMDKAAERYAREKGGKGSISKGIREAVRQYVTTTTDSAKQAKKGIKHEHTEQAES
jgi:hypothetical protein